MLTLLIGGRHCDCIKKTKEKHPEVFLDEMVSEVYIKIKERKNIDETGFIMC